MARKKQAEADMLMAADMRYCLVGIAGALQVGTDTTYLPSELAKMSERLSNLENQPVL